ncbi:MAG TPA: hypothetical protein VGF81_11140 [Solirubrobacteraceae bacterium]|jgi:hypothetical protein
MRIANVGSWSSDGRVIRRVSVGAPAGQVAYSPDGRTLAATAVGGSC